MSDPELKARILRNRFAFILRTESRVDETDWAQLSGDLQTLAVEWRQQRDVDKEVVGWLIDLLLTTIGAMEGLTRASQQPLRSNINAKLMDLYSQIDDLLGGVETPTS